MNTTSESLLLQLQHDADANSSDVENSARKEQAWETFVRLYTPLVFYWARKVGLEQADAADLVQIVFAIVFRQLPNLKYDRQGSFRGWLRTVRLNKFRSQRRKKTLPTVDATDSLMGKLASIPQAESTWDLDYGRILLKQAMDQMECDFEPATWSALKSVMCQKSTVQQAAEQNNISPWTIYSARARLMRRLREQLEGLF